MFNLSSFAPNQNPRYSPTKPLQNGSSSFIPLHQAPSSWENPTFNTNGLPQENFIKGDMPYNIRVLLENEPRTSSTSSGSEETDPLPNFGQMAGNAQSKEWDYSQGELGRRKSEIVSVNTNTNNSIIFQNTVNGFEQSQANSKSWASVASGKVDVKPSFFSPLNVADFTKNERKAYFVTIEGYNQANSKRFFKIARLCHSLQGNIGNGGKDATKFLYLSLWNDCHSSQEEMENIFEPWIYAVPHLNFRLVIKIYMTHTNEDPFVFDFPIDLRQFALPTQDKRTQSLEIVYAEQVNTNSPGRPGNNITLHVQVTNEKLLAPPGFKNSQEQGPNQPSFDYTMILRQFFIGLPLTRPGSLTPQSPLLPQNMSRLNDAFGKKPEQKVKTIEAPQSPLSWSNLSGETSPTANKQFTFTNTSSNQLDPMMPPGILTNTSQQDLSSFSSRQGSSLFKFNNNNNNNNRQQRYSIQPVKREPEAEETKKIVRMQTSDLSNLHGERNSSTVTDAAAAKSLMNASRKESITSESTNGTTLSTISKFQPTTSNETENQNNKSQGSPNTTIIETPETPQKEEETITQSQVTNSTDTTITSTTDDFKIEAYIGRMVEYAKTYQVILSFLYLYTDLY